MNPIVNGYFADPEVRIYEGKYYVYVTQSFTRYKKQKNIDVFSSKDGVHYEHHKNIIDMSGFEWISKAVWAPTVVERDGVYYLMFSSNDIKSNGQKGGIEIAYSKCPIGPFKALLDEPLIGEFRNSAQPIDPHLFKDKDGEVYLYYGGWGHCNVVKLSEDMKSVQGEYIEITPKNYVEAPFMLQKDNKYYFMWSSGNWMTNTYKVFYSIADSPFGPFENGNCILEGDKGLAKGPGHHSVIKLSNSDDYMIYYHRRRPYDYLPGKRILCRDIMKFKKDGEITPIKMT